MAKIEEFNLLQEGMFMNKENKLLKNQAFAICKCTDYCEENVVIAKKLRYGPNKFNTTSIL